MVVHIGSFRRCAARNAPVFDKEGGKYIFLIDSDFMVYKIDIISGKLAWKTKIPIEFSSNIPSASPVISGRYLIILYPYETVLG